MSTPRQSSMAMPVAAIVISAAGWGLWWIGVRALDARGLTGERASLALFVCSSLILLPHLLLRYRRGARMDGATILAAALYALVMVSWNHALIVGDVVRVTLLFYLAPVWATLFGFFVLGDRPTAKRLAGIGLGLGGAATILGAGTGDLPLPRELGDWLALAAGVGFAASATVMRRAGGTSDYERTFLAFALGALLALALVLADGSPMFPPQSLAPGMALAFGFAAIWVVPTTWLLFWGASRLDPGRVSILLLVEVLAAAGSAAILTDEPFGPREWIGGIMIVAAAIFEGRNPPPAPEHPVEGEG